MKVNRITVVFLAMVALSALLTGAVATADIPAADPSANAEGSVSGVAHHWVQRSLGVMPYTEVSNTEKAALVAARRALRYVPAGVVRNADHGYASVSRKVALAAKLKDSVPAIIGHELVVWNDGRAVRAYVNEDGIVSVLETGTLTQLLPSHTTAIDDHGARDASQIAMAASSLSSALDPKAEPTLGSLVTAHVVGVAAEDGSHLVLRVDRRGDVTFEDW